MLDFLDALFHLDTIIRHWRATLGVILIGGGLYVALGLKMMVPGLILVPVGLFFLFWEIFVYMHGRDD